MTVREKCGEPRGASWGSMEKDRQGRRMLNCPKDLGHLQDNSVPSQLELERVKEL